MNIEERINRIEKKLGDSVPGTSLTRILGEKKGVRWSFGIGHMAYPKQFFNAPTIDKAISLAEKELGIE